jgi:hypothetical protein
MYSTLTFAAFETSRAYRLFSSDISTMVTSAPSIANGIALLPVEPKRLIIRCPLGSPMYLNHRRRGYLGSFPLSIYSGMDYFL